MILNIYKPKHWTSFDVVAKLRKTLGTKKIGHAGTLDPLAEGVLVVLTDKDTKRQVEFMEMKKEYLAEIIFGVESPTYDMEGPLRLTKPNPSADVIASVSTVLPDFIGIISQQVPLYSAVKVDGKRLYQAARALGKGHSGSFGRMEPPIRDVSIYAIQLIDTGYKEVDVYGFVHSLPFVKILVSCSKGTYIRSLAHDLGVKIGCSSVLFSLVRTMVGPHLLKDSKSLEKVVD